MDHVIVSKYEASRWYLGVVVITGIQARALYEGWKLENK